MTTLRQTLTDTTTRGATLTRRPSTLPPTPRAFDAGKAADRGDASRAIAEAAADCAAAVVALDASRRALARAVCAVSAAFYAANDADMPQAAAVLRDAGDRLRDARRRADAADWRGRAACFDVARTGASRNASASKA